MVHRPSQEIMDCTYCHEELEDENWLSSWVGSIHYKINKCFCGKKTWHLAPFAGSGHDNFTKESELESAVKLVKGGRSDQ
jgi:hypothetical protein